MNISEFERTKPVETMKALNALIKKVEKMVDNGCDDEDIIDVCNRLKDIKEKLKKGRVISIALILIFNE